MITPHTLQIATDGFRGVVDRIGDDQWELPTPCDGWSVRQLVGHVASGSRMAALLADGGSRDDAIAVLAVDQLGDDPVGAVTDALARQQEVFERTDVADQVFAHPAGDMPGSQVLNFRVGDLVAHQWDLARAIGADETLPAEAVEDAWSAISPMVPMMAISGVFGDGPSGAVTDDAPLQLRLLDAMGRRP